MTDRLFFFLTIFFAFIICLICLTAYLGAQGFLIAIAYFILPFLVEYILSKFNLPFFQGSLITNISFKNLDIPINIRSLFLIFTLPLQFSASLFFAQKFKIFIDIKNLHKTFIIITASLFLAFNFIAVYENYLEMRSFLKWFVIALIINLVLGKLFTMKVQTADIYKELPIILYLSLLSIIGLNRLDYVQLILAGFLTIVYLLLLYNEYKIRKLASAY
jgi:hypothetical protein